MIHHPFPRRAFTLIELMVVIVILVLLMGIGLAVANQVTQGGKIRTTQSLLRVMDQTLGDYQSSTGKKLTGIYRDTDRNDFPLFDGRVVGFDALNTPATPSQAIYMCIIRESASAMAMLSGIDQAFVTTVNTLSYPGLGQVNFNQPSVAAKGLVIVKDAWGEPLRVVHPKWHGGFGQFYKYDGSAYAAATPARGNLDAVFRSGSGEQNLSLRRAAIPYTSAAKPNEDGWLPTWTGDADEGLCQGGAPYFYSSGPDKDPGRRADNLYTNIPTFTAESRDTTGN